MSSNQLQSPHFIFFLHFLCHLRKDSCLSPVSFHASFVTQKKTIILDIQDSKLLLQTDVAQHDAVLQGQFSPDGYFFACKKSVHESGVWKNIPTGYMPWSSLRSRLDIWGISWSPASASILCKSNYGIQLLCLSSCLSPPPPSMIEPIYGPQNHLVAYSVDQVHIVMAQQSDNVVTVLNYHLGTSQKFIDTDMQILDVKIVDNTIFAIDNHILVSWDFKAGGIAHNTHGTRRMIPDWTQGHWGNMSLSHDCSWIAAYTHYSALVFYVKTLRGYNIKIDGKISGIQFSPDGHKLWISGGGLYYFVKLEVPGNWNSLDGEDQTILEATEGDGELLFSHSSCGHSCGIDFKWVMDPQGRKILWLPPNWRFNDWREARWDGNFLALLHKHHPEPIIIEFHL